MQTVLFKILFQMLLPVKRLKHRRSVTHRHVVWLQSFMG